MESTSSLSAPTYDEVTRRLLARVSFVLVSPRVSENVGAAARVLKNFALGPLRLVAPRDYAPDRARRMARDGLDILETSRTSDTLDEAIAELTFVAATTARLGDARTSRSVEPAEAARRLLAAASTGPVGLLFGPEESGLTNRQLDVCDVLVTIPTNPDFSSMNLAQAVAVMGYELARTAASPSFHRAPDERIPVRATAAAVEGFFSDARKFLLEAGFLNPQNPDAVLLHLRRLLARAEPTAHDVQMLRGIIRQVRWYAEQKPDSAFQDDGSASNRAS